MPLDRRMPNSGRRATNIAPKFNNGKAAGRRNPAPRRRMNPQRGTPGKLGEYSNFPAPQKPAANFLPMTPQFEAGRRGLDDEFMSGQTSILNQRNMIDPLYKQQLARMDTDQGFATNSLKENLADRGIYNDLSMMNTPSQYLYNQNIQIPYGRERSDLATAASGAYGQSAEALSGLNLQHNQGLAELLLNRAADAAANIPGNVPQYSTGGRVLRGQRYSNQPQRGSRRGRRGSTKKK